jgi:hypothetical protein
MILLSDVESSDALETRGAFWPKEEEDIDIKIRMR